MYPRVIGESATVRKLLKGYSIARFGDGELKILDGQGYSREPINGHLTAEMMLGVRESRCLLGIPTMDPAGPKFASWQRHEQRFCKYFEKGDGERYYSAFITRPDSAAENLESLEYCSLIARLWLNKPDVVVLSEPTSKLLTCVKRAQPVKHIECPSHGAYARIDAFEAEIVAAKPSIALLSCGPTATCLAHRLARKGIQAIDMGSIGGLLMRWLGNDRSEM
jgi:hypothetical protein